MLLKDKIKDRKHEVNLITISNNADIMKDDYMMVNENADSYNRKTDTYIVAYFDLLGVASRIKSDIEQQKCQ